jgi:hypothetical protein
VMHGPSANWSCNFITVKWYFELGEWSATCSPALVPAQFSVPSSFPWCTPAPDTCVQSGGYSAGGSGGDSAGSHGFPSGVPIPGPFGGPSGVPIYGPFGRPKATYVPPTPKTTFVQPKASPMASAWQVPPPRGPAPPTWAPPPPEASVPNVGQERTYRRKAAPSGSPYFAPTPAPQGQLIVSSTVFTSFQRGVYTGIDENIAQGFGLVTMVFLFLGFVALCTIRGSPQVRRP